MDDKVSKLRKKPIKDFTDREALEFVYDKPSIKLDTLKNTGDAEFKSQLQRLRGGRPREDELAGIVCALRDKGKTFSEIKNQVEQESHDYRSEDAYRKLAESRNPKTAKRRKLPTGKNTPR